MHQDDLVDGYMRSDLSLRRVIKNDVIYVELESSCSSVLLTIAQARDLLAKLLRIVGQ